MYVWIKKTNTLLTRVVFFFTSLSYFLLAFIVIDYYSWLAIFTISFFCYFKSHFCLSLDYHKELWLGTFYSQGVLLVFNTTYSRMLQSKYHFSSFVPWYFNCLYHKLPTLAHLFLGITNFQSFKQKKTCHIL